MQNPDFTLLILPPYELCNQSFLIEYYIKLYGCTYRFFGILLGQNIGFIIFS
jgi:hypothetical protein